MFPHLREAGNVSTRSRGAVPRPEAGMRASCPFPSLHLAGGASICNVTTAWSGTGRKVLWQLRSSDSGGDGSGGSATPERRQWWCVRRATHHVSLRWKPGIRGRTAVAGILALAASAGGAAADCWQDAELAYERLETSESVRCLEALADEGHVRAKLNFGIYLKMRGRLMGERTDIDRGNGLVREAAEAGHVAGSLVLASDAYEEAKPVSGESWTYWRALYQAYEGTIGIVGALRKGTSFAQSRHKYDAAVFAEEAANGDREALMAMAIGYWLKRDRYEVTREQLISAFERAAEHGDERGAHALSWIYETGDVVPKDPEKVEQYREQALEAGYAHAYRLMASRVFKKYGDEAFAIRKEMTPAWLKWVQEGENGENPKVALAAAQDETKLRGRAESIKWLRQGLASGNPALLYDLGERLIEDAPEGSQGERDREEGRALVLAAAELGHPYAATKVGDWYANGDGVDRDEREAGRWYFRAMFVNEQLHGTGVGERRLETDERKNLVWKLHHSTGERPVESGFLRWWL